MFKYLIDKFRKQDKFLFIGYLEPAVQKNCFASPLYRRANNQSQFYIHELSGDLVTSFQKVIIQGSIVYVSKTNQKHIRRNEEAIHCFVSHISEPIVGTKKEIEPSLMRLLFTDKINSGTGLTISSFLNLHGKTEQYLFGKVSSNPKIHLHFSHHDFIDTKKEIRGITTDLLKEIFLKYKEWKKSIPLLSLDDVALFKNEEVFYNKSNFNISNILFDEKEEYKEFFKKLMTMSSRLYYEMLLSDNIINPKKIDFILSMNAEKMEDETVLDVGINVEDKLASKRDKPEVVINKVHDEIPEDDKYTDLLNIATKIKEQSK